MRPPSIWLNRAEVDVSTRARNEPRAMPVRASWETTALRLDVVPPREKAQLTVPLAVTRTALGTELEATVWTAPLRIVVAMLVNAVPLTVPRSTVSFDNATPLLVALCVTARVTSPLEP